MENKKQIFRIGIQFFADGGGANGEGGNAGGDPNNGSGVQNVSLEEYNNLKKELEKFKNRIDEMSKNEKNLKQQIIDKQTDEEKQAQLEKEKDEKLAKYEDEFENMSIKEKLLEGGFTTQEIQELIKEKKNPVSFAQAFSTLYAKKVEEEKKKWQKELVDKTKGVSGGSGGEQNDPDLESYLSNKKTNKQDKAREYFLKK